MHKTSLTDQSMATGAVDSAVEEVQTQTNALLALSAVGDVITADGTEQTLYIDNEPLGCTKGLCLYVDLDNMVGGDTTVIRAYIRLYDAGGLQLWDYNSYTGADGGLANGMKVVKLDLGPYRHGMQLTLQQTAGTNRAYRWELFEEA